jgi:hypothetical protein
MQSEIRDVMRRVAFAKNEANLQAVLSGGQQ